jgi:hypothetical protein
LPGTQPPPFSFGSAGGGASKFASAAESMSPRGGGNATTSISNTVLAGMQGGSGPDGGGQSGPLNVNNWQSNRTASLVVRGVPSANLFLSATGMSG